MARRALTSDHVGTNPTITSERHAQHSHLTMWEHIPQLYKKGPTLTSDHVETHPTSLSERPSTHIRQPMSKRLNTYTRPCEEPILHAERLCTYI